MPTSTNYFSVQAPIKAEGSAPSEFGTYGIKADAILEDSSGVGVTVDGCLIKDGKAAAALAADSAAALTTYSTDTISEKSAGAGVTIDSLVVKDGGLSTVSAGGAAVGLAIGSGHTIDIQINDTTGFMTFRDAGSMTFDDSAGRNYLVLDSNTPKIEIGNATDNPPVSILGNGAVSVGGSLTVTGTISATGGITGVALAADEAVVATVACADATGGSTTAALTVTLKQRDNSTALSSARQVLLVCPNEAYAFGTAPPNVSLSLGTVTKGSIVASLAGGAYWLIETDATGAFACTATNTDDETVYFHVLTANAVSDLTKRCVVVGSNADSAAWSA